MIKVHVVYFEFDILQYEVDLMRVVVPHKKYAVCAINGNNYYVICAVSPRTHVCVGTQRKSLCTTHFMLVQVQAEKTKYLF